MIKYLKRIYHSSPLFVIKAYRQFYSLFCKIRSLFLPLYVIEGLPLEGCNTLRFSYLGWDRKILGHWLKRIFQKYDQIQYIRLVPFWNVNKCLKSKTIGCDLAIVELNNEYIKKYSDKEDGFVLPRWVKMYLDVDLSISIIEKKGEILKRIIKNDLSMEKGSTEQDFLFFYDNMYKPNIIKRHNEAPVIEDYKIMLQDFNKYDSTLYFVIKDGQRIAGLYAQNFDNPYLHAIGSINGSDDILKMGAIGALYYFVLKDQREHNVKFINIGGTSPLIKDGLTRYKLSLGAKVCQCQRQDSLKLKLLPLANSPSVKDFLISNSFIFIENENLHRAVFMDDVNQEPLVNCQKIVARTTAMGIDKTRMFYFDSQNKWSERIIN